MAVKRSTITHFVQQLVADFVCHLFSSRQVAYSWFIRACLLKKVVVIVVG